METHMVFFWLQLSFLAIQWGFIAGGLLSKNKGINLPIVWACVFLAILMGAGFFIYKPT